MHQTHEEEIAQHLGYPATLFGFTPNDTAYWREPGLPWFSYEQWAATPPTGYGPQYMLPLTAYLVGESMAPRFPHDCGVMVAPIQELARLVVGRVYMYSYRHGESGRREYIIARLAAIHGNYVEVQADNCSTPAIWPLRAEAGRETWDLYEVTHYVSYPVQ